MKMLEKILAETVEEARETGASRFTVLQLFFSAYNEHKSMTGSYAHVMDGTYDQKMLERYQFCQQQTRAYIADNRRN